MSAASNEQTCRNPDVALDGIRKANAGLLKLAEIVNGGRAIEESKRRHAEKIENRRAARRLASKDGD
jgi:hypothetical protein